MRNCLCRINKSMTLSRGDIKYTFYIDMVDGTFGKNSLATERYPIMDSIDLMFQKILTETTF